MPFWIGVACLVITIVFGGDVIEQNWQFNLMVVAGLLALGAAITDGAWRDLGKLPLSAKLLLGLIVMLPIVQVIPLPPFIWNLFPGRDVERDIYGVIGASGDWLPVSVEPLHTMMAVLLLAPLAALFLLAFRATQAESFIIAAILCALVALASLVGVIQLVSAGQSLDFYDKAFRGPMLGFVTNRNHMALHMALGILIGGSIIRICMGRTLAAAVVTSAWSLFLICVILGTASRAGFVLGCLATSLTLAQYVRKGSSNNFRVLAFLGGVSGLGMVLIVLSGAFGRLLERFAVAGSDLRLSVWEHSAHIARDYFPVGAGFGTFENVYRKYEQIDWVSTVYMNQAHEEYIQVVLEAGLPGLIAVVLMIVVWASALWTAFRSDPKIDRQARLMAIMGGQAVLLFGLHSLVDYPLRTPTLSALFAVALAWLLRARLTPRNSSD